MTQTFWQITASGLVGLLLGIYTITISNKTSIDTTLLLIIPVLLLFALMILRNVTRTLLAVIIIEIPIQLDMYLDHQADIAELGAVSGINISITTLCLITLYALWAVEALIKMPTFKIQPLLIKWSLPSITYFSLVFLSLLVAPDKMLSVAELVILAQALLLYFYLIHAIRHKNDLIFAFIMLVIGLFLEASGALLLQIFGSNIHLGPVSLTFTGPRINGTFGSPNVFGGYLTLVLASAFGLLTASVRPVHKILAGLSIGFGAISLVLTFSRGGWAGFLLAVLLFTLVAWYYGKLSFSIPLLMSACSILFIFFFGEQIAERVLDYNNPAAQARFPLIELAFLMAKDNPWLGVGANNFAVVLPQYLTPDFSQKWIFVVHNKYMLVLAETGILGFLAFLWFLMSIVHHAWSVWKVQNPVFSPLTLGILAGLIGNLLHMTVEIYHGRAQIHMLWLSAGLVIVMKKLVYEHHIESSHSIRTLDAESEHRPQKPRVVRGQPDVTAKPES